jgi:hypothetical protein
MLKQNNLRRIPHKWIVALAAPTVKYLTLLSTLTSTPPPGSRKLTNNFALETWYIDWSFILPFLQRDFSVS